ncbi:MAG: glycosyltransferase [Candidatus Pacearchaeota archaeon]|nr:glycosyltransferase [Candidatus Pacearchaeota archaeon]
MKRKLKVSFISTVLNEEENLEKFLESLLNQSVKPDEVILVDGGSKDKTLEIMRLYQKKSKIPFRIIIKKGANIADGRNIAINSAKYGLIFVSDAGCIINKDWINETLKFFPENDVVAGSYKAIIKNDFEFFQSLIVIKKIDRPSRMSSRNICFKKACWKKAGGYPEKCLTGEDTKFNISLIENKCKIVTNQRKDISWEMRPTIKKFFKQFYKYGEGDRIQGNLKKLRLNGLMVISFWIYCLALIVMLIVNSLIFLILLVSPIISLLIISVRYFFKTKRISALYYIPLLELTKRVSYVLGATFG